VLRVLRLRQRPWTLPSDTPNARPARELDAEALATIGIDLDEVRRRVEEQFGAGALERTRAGRRPRH
jgi:hypothetical protein